MLWSSGELGNAVLAIDPATDKVQKIDVGDTAHWVAVSHATGKVFVSVKSGLPRRGRHRAPRRDRPHQAAACGRGARDLARRRHALCLRAGRGRVLRRSTRARHALTRTVPIDGADAARRSRCGACGCRPTTNMSWCRPTRTHHAAIYEADGLKQIASIPTKKSPMGFGFAPDGKHAYVCCHDDAEVFEFELATGRVTRTFPTAAGCEFIVAYRSSLASREGAMPCFQGGRTLQRRRHEHVRLQAPARRGQPVAARPRDRAPPHLRHHLPSGRGQDHA